MRKHLLFLPVAALALMLGGQAAYYAIEPPTTTVHASWAFRPQSLGEARGKADSIVHAEVLKVERGNDIVTAAPGEPNNEDRIPTQRVTLKVLKSLKGPQKAGDTIELFQTGGLQLPSAPSDGPGKDQSRVQAKMVILEGDPLYQVGEQHLLMLDKGLGGMMKTVAPEGRYKVERGGTLSPAVDNAVTAQLRGKSLVEAERQVGAGN